MKKVLPVFLVILLALITALFFITFESPRLKDFLVAKAEGELGCKIEIERLTVNLLRGARLKNVALYLRQEPDQKPLLKAADFYLKHKLLESLIQRKLIIDEVVLSEPAVFVVRDENNLPHLVGGTGEQAPKREEEEENRISLLISKIVIKDGRLTLKDKKAGTELDLKEIGLRVKDFSLDEPFDFSLNIGRRLKAEGKVNIDKKDVKAKVLCKEFDLTVFKPYLPANLEVKSLSADLEAELVQANALTLQGNGQLSGISFVQSPLAIQNEGLSLEYDLAADLLAKKIILNHLKVVFLGTEISSFGTIENFRTVAATISCPKIRLADAGKIVPLGKTEIKGLLSLKAKLDGSLTDLAKIGLDGQASFKEVQVMLSPLTKEVRLSGSCNFSREKVSTEDLTGRLGRSDFSLLATVRDLQGAPKADFSLSSNLTDLDELLAAYKEIEEKPGASSKESAREEKINLTASGKVDIRELTYQKESFPGVRALVKLADNRLEITSLNANLYNGSLTGQGSLGLTEVPSYEFKGKAEGIAVNRILSHLTSVQDKLFGNLSTNIRISGKGFSSDQIKKNLSLSGNIKVGEGKLSGELPLKEELLGVLGISKKKDISYKDLSAGIKIEDGAIKTEDFGLKSQEVNILASGKATLDGKLNFSGKFDLSKDLADKVSGDLAGLLKDKEGRIKIPYELGGTFLHPKFKLTTKGIKEEIKQKIKEEAKEEVDKLKEEAKEKIEEEKEKAKEKAKEKIEEEAKKLFDKFRR
ncbi:AsmA family protein [bacterium]|nr:AsmA family protein [bacterium]